MLKPTQIDNWVQPRSLKVLQGVLMFIRVDNPSLICNVEFIYSAINYILYYTCVHLLLSFIYKSMLVHLN